MAKYRYSPKYDLTSETSQDYKTLHQTLDEYLRTGVLDTPASESSYDFDSADEVDFNKPVPHDVDIYDATSGHDDPFLGVTPIAAADADTSSTSPDGVGAQTNSADTSVIE